MIAGQHAPFAAAAAPAGFAGKGGGPEVIVRIIDFAYVGPDGSDVVTVKAGTTITWVNEDTAPHTVTGGDPMTPVDDRPFDSSGQAEGRYDMMFQGDTWSFTFTRPGTYVYFCLPHTFMVATVVVVDGKEGE